MLKLKAHGLQEAGTVLHLARSGRLIIKTANQIADGTLLVDTDGRRTGRVMETIGPVASPYLSVQPMTDRIERLVGSKLFISETTERRNSHGPTRPRYKSNKGRANKQHARSQNEQRNNRRAEFRDRRSAGTS